MRPSNSRMQANSGKHEGQGPSWGFAVGPTGILVIRCWYLLLAQAFACFVVMLFVLVNPALIVPGLPLGLYFLWCLYLEVLGVSVAEDSVTYPVRLGIDTGIFPLFRKTVQMSNVLQASSRREKEGIRIAYLSGEFGQAKLLFDTKGGRDRFFAILNTRFPNVKIYRWT